jgi:hypothetical protein
MGTLVILPVDFLTFVAVSIVINILDQQRLHRLAAERQGKSICRFARSLDYRRLDTKIIRAVYEGFQDYLGPSFPLRASDDLDQTYRIDREDLDDIANEIAGRCGRSMDGWAQNPYYGKVSTVSDLIEFLSALPKAQRM